jgi:hypothetical protein|tara:strand:- start:13796 stop:14398 length:603 start_codon:yes stop_codon:yes gene_type:complete
MNITTPKGIAFYPRLATPDTEWNKDGVYSCKLHLSETDYKAFELQINEIVNKAYKAECVKHGKESIKLSDVKKPLRVTDNGDFEIFGKQVAAKDTRKGRLEFKVSAFDAKGNKLEEMPNVGSGSTLKMALEIYPYFTELNGFGYSLRLKAVQILDLVEYNTGDANSFGFTAEEDGYRGSGESFNETFEKEEPKKDIQAPF